MANREIRDAQQKLLKEIESMKFSFKMFVKIAQLQAMLKYYANNVLITTRYNKVDDKAGFTYHEDVTTDKDGKPLTSDHLGGATESFVEAPYFEISQFMRDDGYCMASFSNFRSWIQ